MCETHSFTDGQLCLNRVLMEDTIEGVSSVHSFTITTSKQTQWCHISQNPLEGVLAISGGNCTTRQRREDSRCRPHMHWEQTRLGGCYLPMQSLVSGMVPPAAHICQPGVDL